MTKAVGRLAAGALGIAVVAGTSAPADAVSAVEVGWWTATPLVAPDAPPDSVVVEGGLVGELAYGAVRYTLAPEEVPETLTVRLAADAASTPNSTLALCPLTETFVPAQGGSMADAPEYDCEAATVEAPPAADGESYEFDVAALVGGGSLAVAILPTAPTDRVVLSAPDAASLTIADTGPATSGTDSTSEREPLPDSDEQPTAAAPATSGSTTSGSGGTARAPRPAVSTPPLPAPALPSPAAGAPAPAPAQSPAAPSPGGGATPAAATDDSGSSGTSWLPPVAFVGLAALAAALWLGRRSDEDGDDADVLSAPQPA